jgi:hypothetical protein
MHGRFGAGTGEADTLATGNDLAKHSGEVGMQLILVRASCTALEHVFDGLANSGIAVTEHGRAVAAAEIDVLSSVQIPYATTGRSIDQERVTQRAIEPDGRAYAPRQVLARFAILFCDTRHLIGPHLQTQR